MLNSPVWKFVADNQPAASVRLRILVRSLQYIIHLISNETGDANQGKLKVRSHLDE